MFGKMWPRTMRGSLQPIARAASTNSRFFIASTWPRDSRVNPGIATTPMAIIALRRSGPRAAVMAIASSSAGNARSASMSRIDTRSKAPPM